MVFPSEMHLFNTRHGDCGIQLSEANLMVCELRLSNDAPTVPPTAHFLHLMSGADMDGLRGAKRWDIVKIAFE